MQSCKQNGSEQEITYNAKMKAYRTNHMHQVSPIYFQQLSNVKNNYYQSINAISVQAIVLITVTTTYR